MRSDLNCISEALIACGYTALDEQAKALGLHRSTTWTIMKNKHKLGRLSAKTINRILTNPKTPVAVRSSCNSMQSKHLNAGLLQSQHSRTNGARILV
jgi:hypothetical protein